MKHPLTAYREKHELTLAEFGNRVGATKGMVWKWERGTAMPRPKYAEAIFKATHGTVTPNDFVLRAA